MPTPLQVDNIFVFIRQAAHVPARWLFKTSATSWRLAFWPCTWCPSHKWRGLSLCKFESSLASLFSSYARCTRETDVRQKHRLMPPPPCGEYRRCLQLSTDNVYVRWLVVRSRGQKYPRFRSLLQLTDIVSLTGLMLIVCKSVEQSTSLCASVDHIAEWLVPPERLRCARSMNDRASKAPFIAQQLNSTQLDVELSWVDLRRRPVYSATTQLNSTRRLVVQRVHDA